MLALLPNIGKAAAAGAVASFRSSYLSLRLAFLVGICGGVPSPGTDEVLLGDVVISKIILQYDFGRQYHNKPVPKDTVKDSLGRPNKDICSLIAIFETEQEKQRLQQNAAKHLKSL